MEVVPVGTLRPRQWIFTSMLLGQALSDTDRFSLKEQSNRCSRDGPCRAPPQLGDHHLQLPVPINLNPLPN